MFSEGRARSKSWCDYHRSVYNSVCVAPGSCIRTMTAANRCLMARKGSLTFTIGYYHLDCILYSERGGQPSSDRSGNRTMMFCSVGMMFSAVVMCWCCLRVRGAEDKCRSRSSGWKLKGLQRHCSVGYCPPLFMVSFVMTAERTAAAADTNRP